MKRKLMFRIIVTTAVLGMTLCLAPQSAMATSKEVVGSKYDNKVQTKSGSCVRTRWQTGEDACGIKPIVRHDPIPEPAPYIAPPPPPPKVQQVAPRPAPPVTRTVIKQEARTIYFDSGKSVLTPGGERKLDQLAAVLKGAKDIQRVEIVGFADPMGKAKANMSLSQRRAAAVQAYLNQHGYMSTSLAKTRAVGDTQASADCGSKMKRAKKVACLVTDRKVEVEVVYAETLRN
ncbi:MAG: OmpA family protein [Alphaproteobacteria bacterium]|nr:OmpA family protein [Alphaproteobacteria bacterium]